MPLAGTGNVLGAEIANALGVTDAKGQAAWASVATALIAHFITNTVVSPLPAMVAPPGTVGGPVTGAGKLL